MKLRKAFTLIELMVVILILAILAALVVPRLINKTGDAKRAKAISDISAFRSMLQNFHIDTDRYPTTEEGLQALVTPPANANNWKGPYSDKAIPPDPWGNPYVYTFPGAEGNDSFSLISYGADGQPGGTGDASDVTQDMTGQ